MALFSTDAWQPLPRPAELLAPTSVTRVPDVGMRALAATGPQVLWQDGGRAHVRFQHFAPSASAVALSASGWWRPADPAGCDLARIGDGWWSGTFEVPADWQASYRFVEHRRDGSPPWWERGLRDPGGHVAVDLANPHRHRGARGQESAVVRMPATERPWLTDFGADAVPPPELPGEPRVRWWAPASDAPLPLLVVTDGEVHTGALATHRVLAAAVESGAVPPVAAVFVESGPARPDVLGVPWGHAQWIGETLVPRLRADGLDGTAITSDPRRTVVTGASFGGLTALFTVARSPGTVGAAVAQSCSLWRYPEGALAGPLVATAARHHIRVRLASGRYEGALPDRAGRLAAELRSHGVDVTAEVVSGGHDWAWWVPNAIESVAELLR